MAAVLLNVDQWANEQFGSCALGDRRRTARLVQYAASDLTANGPWASFTITGMSGYALAAAPARLKWSGQTSSAWNTMAESGNWKRAADGASADYRNGFHVTFDDTAAAAAAEISAADVSPLSVTFDNSATSLSISGAKGIAGATTTVAKRGTATVTISSANTYGGMTTVEAGKLILQGRNKAMHPVLDLGGSDIKGGMLVLDYAGESSPAATVGSLLTTSYIGGGSDHFDSGQFRSSAADAKHGLGWIDDSATSKITVALTRYGDASLDGAVNLSDLTLLGQSWNGAGKVWAQGDFNYDGAVDLSDLTLFGGNWNQSVAGFPTAGPTGLNAVPEPSSIILLAVMAGLAGVWAVRRPTDVLPY